MIIDNRFRLLAAAVLAAALIAGCGGDDKEDPDGLTDTTQISENVSDSVLIQRVLDETVERWREGDRAVLYDQEFEYFRDKISFDQYVDEEFMRRLEADSVASITATQVALFGRDSALVDIEAYLVGVTGQEYRFPDKLMFYYHQGRWMRPSMSNSMQQAQYDSLKRVADSAAAAEEEADEGA